MSEVEMILPEKPVFTPHDCLYGMNVDIPAKRLQEQIGTGE